MQNVSIKGFIYAALSSATFGAGSFFTISLLLAGFSSFEVLAYRWGIASLTLVVFGIMLGETFRISRKDWERCSSSACSGQLPPSVWSSPIRT